MKIVFTVFDPGIEFTLLLLRDVSTHFQGFRLRIDALGKSTSSSRLK